MSQFVRFRIADADRFAALRSLFEEIKAVKNLDFAETIGKSDEFNPADVEYDVPRLERMIPEEVRAAAPWSLAAILDLIDAGDYSLLSCQITHGDVAEIHVEAADYPYGGLGALTALVEGFGCEVLGCDEWGGYVALGGGSGQDGSGG